MKINLFLTFIKSFFLAGAFGFACWWILIWLFNDRLPGAFGMPSLVFFIGGFYNAFISFCLSVVAVIICLRLNKKGIKGKPCNQIIDKFTLPIIIAVLVFSLILWKITREARLIHNYFVIILITNTFFAGFTVVWLFVREIIKANNRTLQHTV